MTAVLVDGLQIVPGYHLEVRLGKGGFGEVWRAIGPGKVPVALKIIAAKGSKSSEREFKSLELLRELRHPNLLPVQAY
jgi:serine/threonine protein kinase